MASINQTLPLARTMSQVGLDQASQKAGWVPVYQGGKVRGAAAL